MITRPFHPRDTEAVVTLINSAATFDGTRRLSQTAFVNTWSAYAEPGTAITYDHTAVAVDESENILGFTWWAVGSSSPARNRPMQIEGWVHPSCRRQGVGTVLLTAVDAFVQAYLRRENGTLTLYSRVYADVPGGEQLYSTNGYTLSRRFHILRTALQGKTWAADIPHGITFKTFRTEDLELLVEADNAIFADHWGSKQRSLPVWQHDMMETRPHDPKLWILAWTEESIVGECLCHASNQGDLNDGWISIMGVQRHWRGKGLGRALLAHGLARLRDAGFDTATLSVDADNSAAVNLYRSLGMDVIRTRLHFTKSFEL